MIYSRVFADPSLIHHGYKEIVSANDPFGIPSPFIIKNVGIFNTKALGILRYTTSVALATTKLIGHNKAYGPYAFV